MKIKILRILVALPAIVFVSFGVRWLVAPAGIAPFFGMDLMEVAPAYDTTGNTALLAANLLYEMLCVLPGVEYRGAPD